MNYGAEITRILAEAGEEGLSLQKLSLHVFNACNTLFEAVGYDTVRAEVYKFLLRNSKTKTSLVEHMEKRGMYRLNPRSSSAMQLVLQFSDEKSGDATSDSVVEQDFSLSLF